MSLAKKHRARCLAKVQQSKALEFENSEAKAKAKGSIKPKGPKNYAATVTGARLNSDLATLRSIADIPARIEHKRNVLVPTYLPLVTAYAESGENAPNDMLVNVVIWLLDIGDIDRALPLAMLAIDQGQAMPERFKTDLPTFVTRTLCDWAEGEYQAENSASPYLETVVNLVQANTWPVEEIIVLTRLYKIMARYCEKQNDHRAAVTYYEKCIAVNPEKHGVKTRLHIAKKLAEQATPPTPPAATSDE